MDNDDIIKMIRELEVEQAVLKQRQDETDKFSAKLNANLEKNTQALESIIVWTKERDAVTKVILGALSVGATCVAIFKGLPHIFHK